MKLKLVVLIVIIFGCGKDSIPDPNPAILIAPLNGDNCNTATSISLDETVINEAGATSTLTATLSTAHSEDVIIPLTISGTASLADYSTAFATKGTVRLALGLTSRIKISSSFIAN